MTTPSAASNAPPAPDSSASALSRDLYRRIVVKTPTTPEQILNQIVRHFLSPKGTEVDAAWFMGTLASDPDLIKFFRAEVLAALDRKTTRDGQVDAIKRRKIFYALGGAGRVIFGDTYDETKRRLDTASKAAQTSRAAVRKADAGMLSP